MIELAWEKDPKLIRSIIYKWSRLCPICVKWKDAIGKACEVELHVDVSIRSRCNNLVNISQVCVIRISVCSIFSCRNVSKLIHETSIMGRQLEDVFCYDFTDYYPSGEVFRIFLKRLNCDHSLFTNHLNILFYLLNFSCKLVCSIKNTYSARKVAEVTSLLFMNYCLCAQKNSNSFCQTELTHSDANFLTHWYRQFFTGKQSCTVIRYGRVFLGTWENGHSQHSNIPIGSFW